MISVSALPENDPLRTVQAFELEFGLFDFRIDGWSPWRILRPMVVSHLARLPLASRRRERVASRLWRLSVGTVMLIAHLVLGRKRDGVIKSFASALREREGGCFRDVYFDSLLDSGLDCFKIEVIDSPSFEENRKLAQRRAHLNADVIQLWARALLTILPRSQYDEYFRSLELNLQRALGIQLPWRGMRNVVYSIFWQIRIYRWMLRRLQPRFVAVTDTAEYALSVACRRERVRFIELQHGIFGRTHPDVPPGKAAGDGLELMLPEFLAVFGDFWRRCIQGTAFDRVQVVPVGSGQIEKARQMRLRRRSNGQHRIVATSQGLDTERLGAWLETMIRSAPDGTLFELIIKLHPTYDRDRGPYNHLASLPQVRVIGGAESPSTYELIAHADLHISISSACHFDALGIGVPTVIVPLATHETVLDLVDGVCVHLVSEPHKVWEVLATDVATTRAEEFYKSGFVGNMRALVA